MKEDLPIDKCD